MQDFKLLLRTRLVYDLNYIRAHFDRVTILYIFLIGLTFLFLLARSPGDMGFSLAFLSAPDFPKQWLVFWSGTLFAFYLFAVSMAWLTLRPTSESALFGALPLNKNAVFLYCLTRLWLKIATPFLLGVALFLVANTPFYYRFILAMFAFAAFGFLMILAFKRASLLIISLKNHPGAPAKWVFQEMALLILLITLPNLFFTSEIPQPFVTSVGAGFLMIVSVWLFRKTSRDWTPEVSGEIQRKSVLRKSEPSKTPATAPKQRSLTRSLIFQDFLYLKRTKKSLFIWMGAQAVFMFMITLMNPEFRGAVAGMIFFQCLLGFFILSALMRLFVRDAEVFFLLKSLPISAAKLWRARWLLTAICIAASAILPVLLLFFKFPFDGTAMAFGFVILAVIPAFLATIFCNAGFGTFPHAKYGANLFAVSFVMTVLFWFYVPPATLLLIGLFIFWIRKSIRHLKYLEAA